MDEEFWFWVYPSPNPGLLPGPHFHGTCVRAPALEGTERPQPSFLWPLYLSFPMGNQGAEADQTPTCPSFSSPSQLHNVMVHLQQENKKLKTEIEEKKLKAGHPRLCTKALGPSKMEATQRGIVCSTLGWRGITQDMSQRVDITKCIRMPHCSGMSAVCLWVLTMMSLSPRGPKITA